MAAAEILHGLRLIHHGCRLPLRLYRSGRLAYALPEEKAIPEAEIPALPSNGETQTIAKEAAERYLYLPLEKESALLIGPYLEAALSEAQLGRLARQGGGDRQQQAQRLRQLKALPRLDADNLHYLQELAQMLLQGAMDEPGHDAFPDLRRLYMMNTAENRMQLFRHPPYFLEQELIRLIRRHDKHGALEQLREINRLSRARVARDPVRSLKNSLIGSCALISRAAISGGVSAGEAFTLADSFIQTLESMQDVRALEALEETMVIRFCEQVETQGGNEASAIVKAAMREADEHLDEKLRVQGIARKIYVHPDYLSKLFRKETGETLSHYIQRRRVQEAGHLLRYSNYAISEIATAFQFSSQSNFSQVFKKHTGLSPARYREGARL